MAKLVKKLVAKAKAPKVAKVKKVSAASIVLGLFNMKVVPSDEAIIQAVQEGVEETKFSKTHLAWYKYQFRIGRWNDGEAQVLRQAEKPKAEKAAKPVVKKAVKKVAKKVAKPVADEVEETEVED